MSGKQDVIDLIMAGVDGFSAAANQGGPDPAASAAFGGHLALQRGEDEHPCRAATAAGGLVDAAVQILREARIVRATLSG